MDWIWPGAVEWIRRVFLGPIEMERSGRAVSGGALKRAAALYLAGLAIASLGKKVGGALPSKRLVEVLEDEGAPPMSKSEYWKK